MRKGPDVSPGHTVWKQKGLGTSLTVSRLRTTGGQATTIVLAAGPGTTEPVVVLEENVWMDSLGLRSALERWNRPTTAFAHVSTPNREKLADHRFMSASVTEGVLCTVGSHLGVGVGPKVTIARYSYSGLAAAGLET